MDLLSISDSKCRRCYRCVRECPTNALKIDHGRVKRIPSRCIYCGQCYKHCPHDAVIAHTNFEHVLKLLDSGEKVVICLDPTFPSVLDKGTPQQLVTALKKLGFYEVWESAVGGELVTRAYNSWLRANGQKAWISSFCPSLVSYVEKFVPQLTAQLVPIVSPMVACGMAVKRLRGADTRVVFVGSCISRIWERLNPAVRPYIDSVLIYHDLRDVFKAKGIDREEQDPSDFDGPRGGPGRIMGIAGSMSKCVGFDQDLLNLDYVVEAGAEEAMRAIRQYQEGKIRSRFLDLLFCKGCINGPIVDKNISGPSRRQIIVDYIQAEKEPSPRPGTESLDGPAEADLRRTFSGAAVSLPEPNEEEIRAVLVQLGKTYPGENLDCGACGYNSCWEKAKAVVHGLAEMEMCHHYLLERLQGLYSRLEKSHQQLKISHQELESAQRQLIQTEKMASLGQLAAGVAHELNNPLGAIIMFSRILQKEIPPDEQWQKDLTLVIQEADRAAKIVKDLLSFSRETKIKPGLISVHHILEEALSLLVKQSLFHNIQIIRQLDASLPETFADPDLLKQVFLNIFLNAAQAMDGKGTLTLQTLKLAGDKAIEISIQDSGAGISDGDLSRLFDPFFTTKEKGTGLGLSLVYSIVSKHKGTVRAESRPGQGATFIIDLPVLGQEEWATAASPPGGLRPGSEGNDHGAQSEDLIG